MNSSIGNSGYDRIDRDHYPTPGENVGAAGADAAQGPKLAP